MPSTSRRTLFIGPNDGGSTLYAKGKGSVTSSRHSSSISMGAFFPVLLAVAMIFYVLGFIQSIRSLPDVNNHEFLKSPNGGALGRAILPLVEKVRRKNNNLTAVVLLHEKQQQPQPQGDEAQGAQKTTPEVHDVLRKENVGPKVPEAKWPVSIRDELDNFETILHPGDGKTEMSVPKFWSDPVMTPNGPLMSRDTAMKVGSYDTSNGKKKGSLESRTIFIAIASYRDFQCRDTVDSILKRAKHPERVRVGT